MFRAVSNISATTLQQNAPGWRRIILLCQPSPCSNLANNASFSSTTTVVAPIPNHQHQGKEKNMSTWLKVFCFVPGILTFGLGTWQLHFRQKHMNVLLYRRYKLGLEQLEGSQITVPNDDLNFLEFRRIQCKGVYDERKSFYLGSSSSTISGGETANGYNLPCDPRRRIQCKGVYDEGKSFYLGSSSYSISGGEESENGCNLITPLFPIPGDPQSVPSPILVNRGWIPESLTDKALHASKSEELSNRSSANMKERGEVYRFLSKWLPVTAVKQASDIAVVEVEGVARGSELAIIQVRANNYESSDWFTFEVPAVARACGLPDNTIYVDVVNDSHINSNSTNYPIPKNISNVYSCQVMPDDNRKHVVFLYIKSIAWFGWAVRYVKWGKGK